MGQYVYVSGRGMPTDVLVVPDDSGVFSWGDSSGTCTWDQGTIACAFDDGPSFTAEIRDFGALEITSIEGLPPYDWAHLEPMIGD